jgi:hypothetical protein
MSFNLDEGALDGFLTDRGGPIGLWLEAAVIRVESQAKVNASGRPGPRVRTGRLRSGIFPSVGLDQRGLVGRVTSPVFYSGYVETGTTRSRPYPYLRPALSAV